MPIELTTIDPTEFIIFKTWIMLTNGIIGKQIIVENINTNYIITPDAMVFNITTEYQLKPFISNTGYYSINIQLGKYGYYKTRRLHQLLGLAYIPNPENKPVINHIDANKLNLLLSNLEWATIAENNAHARRLGLVTSPKPLCGENSNLTTHTADEVRFICEKLQAGYSPKKLSREYNFGYDFIQKIRRGIAWRDISKDYDFPNIRRYSEIFTPFEMKQMDEYFAKGYKVREVIDLMGYEYNEHIRGNVKHQKERFKNDLKRKMTISS